MPNPQADYLMYLMLQGLLPKMNGGGVAGVGMARPTGGTAGSMDTGGNAGYYEDGSRRPVGPVGASGGPSTSLGAPAPYTRHGDTAGSMTPQGGQDPLMALLAAYLNGRR
jgi:hypothetical protein